MKPEDVKPTLIQVIQNIQHDSGYGGVPINGSTCPPNDLEGFDSKIWPVATGILATELGVDIPVDKNIFIARDGKRRLTVDEVVAVVCEIINN